MEVIPEGVVTSGWQRMISAMCELTHILVEPKGKGSAKWEVIPVCKLGGAHIQRV